jgi:hypothetical protein
MQPERMKYSSTIDEYAGKVRSFRIGVVVLSNHYVTEGNGPHAEHVPSLKPNGQESESSGHFVSFSQIDRTFQMFIKPKLRPGIGTFRNLLTDEKVGEISKKLRLLF